MTIGGMMTMSSDSFRQQDDSIVEPQAEHGDTPLERERDMEQQSLCTTVTILHELDLGQHTLFVMNDGTIDLIANGDEPAIYLADNVIQLGLSPVCRAV